MRQLDRGEGSGDLHNDQDDDEPYEPDGLDPASTDQAREEPAEHHYDKTMMDRIAHNRQEALRRRDQTRAQHKGDETNMRLTEGQLQEIEANRSAAMAKRRKRLHEEERHAMEGLLAGPTTMTSEGAIPGRSIRVQIPHFGN